MLLQLGGEPYVVYSSEELLIHHQQYRKLRNPTGAAAAVAEVNLHQMCRAKRPR